VQAGHLPFPLPGVLGHEGAGVVAEVGAAVTSVGPGDQVLLSFSSCGRCPGCRAGRPALCDTWLPRNLLGGARPDGSAPIGGAGAVGLSAVMAAALSPAAQIIAVDRVPARLDLARELGATDTVETTGADLAAVLTELTRGRGADLVLDATGAPAVIAAGLAGL